MSRSIGGNNVNTTNTVLGRFAKKLALTLDARSSLLANPVAARPCGGRICSVDQWPDLRCPPRDGLRQRRNAEDRVAFDGTPDTRLRRPTVARSQISPFRQASVAAPARCPESMYGESACALEFFPGIGPGLE